jgi:hypothetical protein
VPAELVVVTENVLAESRWDSGASQHSLNVPIVVPRRLTFSVARIPGLISLG